MLTGLGFPFYIARRYLLAKKSHHVINIISVISLAGMLVGTMALVVILSVFNGFDSVVRSLINSYNPDIRITLAEGKTFLPDSNVISELSRLDGVMDVACALEDKALVRYDEQQTIATVCGVSDNYLALTGLDSMVVEGRPVLRNGSENVALIGYGIKIFLNVILNSPRQLILYAPRRLAQVSLDAERALNRRFIPVAGIFSVEQDFDSNYIIVPLEYARDLFGYHPGEITSIDIKTSKDNIDPTLQEKMKQIMGNSYVVRNRYQQNELFYKTMQTEKWAIFFILVFILFIASFNVIGTLTMLIIEKKKDIITLRNLGANPTQIKRIFLFEGWMISVAGAATGVVAGLLVCWLQMRFELIKLQGSGTFVIDAYPVQVQAADVLLTLLLVLIVGFFAAWYPIRYMSRQHASDMDS